MKKLLVIALSVVLVLAFATVSMAEATFSGEIDAGYKTYQVDSPAAGQGDQSMPYLFGKVVMSGKLADSVTGTLVIKDNDDDISASGSGNATAAGNNVGKMVFDEADAIFTVPFGTVKVGYFGWNNNPKDIIDTLRGDVKTDVVINPNFKITDNITLGLAYAIPTSNDKGDTDGPNSAYYGVDLGFATDSFGFDLIYANSSSYYSKAGTDGTLELKDADGNVTQAATAATTNEDRTGTAGINVWYLINGFKPYIQYEIATDDAYKTGTKDDGTPTWVKLKDDPGNTIVGVIYDSADSAWYGRVEYDLYDGNDMENEYGVRIGYKLASGAKLEGQYYGNVLGTKDSKDYIKVVCPF